MDLPKRFSLAWFALAGLIFGTASLLLSLIIPIFGLLSIVFLIWAVILSYPISPLRRLIEGKPYFDPYDLVNLPRVLVWLYLAMAFLMIGLFISLFFTRQFMPQCVAVFPLAIFMWELMNYWKRSF